MLHLDGVAYRCGATDVFRDVSLAVQRGTFWVVYGAPGSGKTTLARLCRGELPPDAGTVSVFGEPVPHGDRRAIAALRRQIGLVERRNRFLPHLSVRDNIAVPIMAEGVSPATRRDDVAAILDWMSLEDQADALPSELSPAEASRAALARALITAPEFVIADDVGLGLSVENGRGVVDLIAEVNRMGKTVLLLSSDSGLVEHVVRTRPARVAQLADGRLQVVE